jgi:hypothetical protein
MVPDQRHAFRVLPIISLLLELGHPLDALPAVLELEIVLIVQLDFIKIEQHKTNVYRVQKDIFRTKEIKHNASRVPWVAFRTKVEDRVVRFVGLVLSLEALVRHFAKHVHLKVYWNVP